MKNFYVRLLSYDNAMELINFVKVEGKDSIDDDYANIVVGGVSVQINDKSEKDVIEFLDGLDVRYEISAIHPTKVTDAIVADLKDQGVIKK